MTQSAASSTVVEEPVSTSSLLADLLIEIQSLAKNKQRCTNALLALKDDSRLARPDREKQNSLKESLGCSSNECPQPDTLDVASLNNSGVNNISVNDVHGDSDTKKRKVIFSGRSKNIRSELSFSERDNAVIDDTVTYTEKEGNLASRGKKRHLSASIRGHGGGKKKKKKKSDGGPLSFDLGEEEDRNAQNDRKSKKNDTIGIIAENIFDATRDAHLIMAATQAINVLISFLSKKNKGDETMIKYAAIVLAALSHDLVKSMVNDKAVLESITAYSSSPSSLAVLPFEESGEKMKGNASPSNTTAWGCIARETKMDIDDDMNLSLGREAEKGKITSTSEKEQQEHKQQLIISYAKTIVARAMTSCVVGALHAMEAIGALTLCLQHNRGGTVRPANPKNNNWDDSDESRKIECNLLRQAAWTSLLSLEIAFQLNPCPKLLMISSVAMPTTGVSSRIVGLNSNNKTRTSSSNTLDFDGKMALMIGGLSSSIVAEGGRKNDANATSSKFPSKTSLSHIHTIMGADTISMWNECVQRIMIDYKLGFRCVNKEDGEKLVDEDNILAQICQQVTHAAFSSQIYSEFISIVLEGNETQTDSSLLSAPALRKSKRTSVSSSKKMMPGKTEKFEEKISFLSFLLAQRPDNDVMFDCHVSVRRWAILAFGWSCTGQKRLLETCLTLLTKREDWKKVMELTSSGGHKFLEPASEISDSLTSKHNRKKIFKETRHFSLENTSNVTPISDEFKGLSGDLVLIIFISCIIDLIYDVGATGGLTPPNSIWMDEYVKAITETPDASSDKGTENAIASFTGVTSSPQKTVEASARRSMRTRSKGTVIEATTASEIAAPKVIGKSTIETKPMIAKGIYKSRWARPDIREEVAVLTKCLIEAHICCLQDSFVKYLHQSELLTSLDGIRPELKRLIVNDDESFQESISYRRSDSCKELSNHFPFFPFMHRTLEALGQIASSSVHASSGSKSIILAIGGAIAMSLFKKNYENNTKENEVVVLDAKLISLSIFHLFDSVRSVSNETSYHFGINDGNKEAEQLSERLCISKDILKKYRLDEPLVTSDDHLCEKNGPSSNFFHGARSLMNLDARDDEADLDKGFSPRKSTCEASNAEVLSFFIRAHLDPSDIEIPHRTGMTSLLKCLFSVIQLCYEFHADMDRKGSNNVGSSLTTMKPLCGGKKKKKSSDFAKTMVQWQEMLSRQTHTRCILASDALNTLRECLLYSPVSTIYTSTTMRSSLVCIRSYFRQCINSEMIINFVKLGYVLEDNLIYPLLFYNMAENKDESSVPENSKVFKTWERRLWSAHVKLSLTIGRGRASPSQKYSSLLEESECMQSVFKAIAAFEEERLSVGSKKMITSLNSVERWPLFLPVIQHSLVASTLSCHTTLPQTKYRAQAGLFLCNSYLNSLEDVVCNLSTISRSEPHRHDYLEMPTMMVNDNTQISLRDARLFSLALGLLSQSRQKAVFTRLLELLHTGLHNATLPLKTAASRVLARGLSLATSVADLIIAPDLLPVLSQLVGSTLYNIPRIVWKPTPETERSCFSKHIVFMGIFADWQSSSVPADCVTFTKTLQDSDYKKFSELIKVAMTIGFATSSQDGCHLLFSSWHAAAKLCSWTSTCWEGPSTATFIKKQDFVERLICLRDDMCEIYNLMKGDAQPPQPQTLLIKLTTNKRGRCQSREGLLSAIASCEKMLAHTTSEVSKVKGLATASSTAAFAYYEALTVYVSFLISMHTKPRTNNISSIQRFQKSHLQEQKNIAVNTNDDAIDEFSSDDSDLENDDFGGQPFRLNALTRLHKACVALGAAPCYPDWLDVSCKMRGDLTPSIAVESAERTLLSLVNFGVAAFKRYCQALQETLGILNVETLSNHTSISTLLLHQLITTQQSLPSSISESFCIHLATFCRIDCTILKAVIKHTYSLPNNDFVMNSSTRIKSVGDREGWKAFAPEHRANEQWEVLLAESLRGSSLQISSESLNLAEGYNSAKLQDLQNALEIVCHWQRVLHNAISAMVPTAALLRFAIHDGKGRNPHPMCHDTTDSVCLSEDAGESHCPTKNEVCTTLKKALSFLSCVFVHSAYNEDLRLTSKAAANHMLENVLHFDDLVALWVVRVSFDAVGGVVNALNASIIDESEYMSASALVEAILKQYCVSLDQNFSVDKHNLSVFDYSQKKMMNLMLAFFGVSGVLQARVIGNRSNVEVISILSNGENCYPMHTDENDATWSHRWTSDKKDLVKMLMSLIAGKFQASRRLTLAVAASLLCDLIKYEAKLFKEKSASSSIVVRLAAAAALNDMSKDDVLLLLDNLCRSSVIDGSEDAKRVVMIISYLATVSHESNSIEIYKTILHEMLEGIDHWACSPVQDYAMSLMCLLASRFGKLHEIGTTVISLALREKERSNLGPCLQSFFHFVVALERFTSSGVTNDEVSGVNPSKAGQEQKKKVIECRTCTFIQTGEGFTEQHWYNCYTCGLLWDKGCCSLCTRVCHEGHDVGYSRKSSFFCDCGAEVATAIEENRTPCKCLSPISEDKFRSINENEYDASEVVACQGYDYADTLTDMVFKSFPSECKKSLHLLIEEARLCKWNETITILFNQCFKNWNVGTVNFSFLFSDPLPSTGICLKKPVLDDRCGLPLTLESLVGQSILPLRAAKSNSLKTRVSPPSSSLNRKRQADSQLIASDDRGRLVCAESSSVIFFTAIPSVNVRHMENPSSSLLSRAQLNILGSAKVKFEVHGITLHPETNRHLALWSTFDACVAIVSKGFDSFDRTIELVLQVEPKECEGEYLLELMWLTETIIVAVYGTVIHVFDLSRTEKNDSCKATTHFALAYEDILIRSAALTCNLSKECFHKKLAILLDSGRLHFIDLYVDNEGALEDEGESYIEIGSGTTFSTGGFRSIGDDLISPGSTSTTLGEGCNLSFLRQSNLLLYQCFSSPCVAMLLDSQGKISGTFELLPNAIQSENLPGTHFGVVTGPYSHFQELGIVKKGGEVFYRISCVGNSSSNQPTLLLLEFNQFFVFIKEITWPADCSFGLGFTSSYSFVGSCRFSAPYFIGGAQQGYFDNETCVFERAILTMLSSTGSLLWFGEDCEASNSNGSSGQKRGIKVDVKPNIYMFEEESIFNLSESSDLIFGGECAGHDAKATKKKLSLNNSEYMISPSREGCTLTARLEPYDSATKSEILNDEVIVAVRVLVGSKPDSIPREITTMSPGRSIKTKRNLKRWYDIPLTDEEILLAVRNGFVTLFFSSCHDSSSSAVIDAVEIYGRNRKDLLFLKPETDSYNMVALTYHPLLWPAFDGQEQKYTVSCIQSLRFLAKILGQGTMSSLTAGNIEMIKRIIERTALDSNEKGTLRAETLIFLNEIEYNGKERWHLISTSTLRGLMTILIGLKDFIVAELSSLKIIHSKHEAMMNQAINFLTHIIISATSIARANGDIYKKSLYDLIEDKVTKASLAIEGKNLLDYLLHLGHSHGCALNFVQAIRSVSELILIEVAFFASNEFAQFETLSDYLGHFDYSVVQASCAAISNTIETPNLKVITEQKSTLENSDGYVTYQCDACKMFPIREVRYTIGGEVDIDLCKNCFDLGCSYASSHDCDSSLIIHGRTLSVENDEMTCDKIYQMKSIAIDSHKIGFPNVEDAAFTEALKMSISNKDGNSSARAINTHVVNIEEFRSHLLSQLLGLLTQSFCTSNNLQCLPLQQLLQLALDVVLNSSTEKLKVARGNQMVLALVKNIPPLLKSCQCDKYYSKLVFCLRTLTSLVTQKRFSPLLNMETFMSLKDVDFRGHSQKDKTNPKFICEMHGVPAVRRRCSHGVHKDRRFYVCGFERQHRCNYFKWADISKDVSERQTGSNDKKSDETFNVFIPIQTELAKVFDENESSSSCMQLQFCDLIRKQFEQLRDNPSVSEAKSDNGSTLAKTKFVSLRCEKDEQRDIADGLSHSWKKLGKSDFSTVKYKKPQCSTVIDESTLISESLFLFSLVAPSNKWSQEWFFVLCAIISTSTSSVLRHLAKRFLQRLCGGRQEIYHRIRDHHVYGYQFQKLISQSMDLLSNAYVVREMARQCGANWREEEVGFETLPPGGLLGVGDLISEDCYPVSYESNVHSILDELLSTASTRSRRSNWRNFCALPEITTTTCSKSPTKGGSSLNEINGVESLFRRPPIVTLFWLSSCLRGANQIKALKLVDISIPDIRTSDSLVGASSTSDEDEISINGAPMFDNTHTPPEQSVITGWTIQNLHTFVIEFVLKGRSNELRSIASSVAYKLASRFTQADKNSLFCRLIDGPFRNDIGKSGITSKEFLGLLHHFILNFSLDLSCAGSYIVSAFAHQMRITNHYLSHKARDVDEKNTLRYDLSNCLYCHKIYNGKNMSTTMKDQIDSSGDSSTVKGNVNWIDEQVRPCVKMRLESSTAASTSNEFSHYIQLKFRLVLSEVQVTVSDPRGRLVKTIGVYFTPRQVSNVNILKSDMYAHLWQKCGMLSLSRHASSSSLKLNMPVVAANLKFTYEEFYEKATGCRAPDGSFILHCPRCTRQVNNAHGVCGNCGEVAFQCKKCRHINYDRLDAFLCVECGYCSSGGFSFDLSVGMAITAIAILDGDEYERSMAMLRIATRRHSELRNSLRKKLLIQEQSGVNGDEVGMIMHGSVMNRAFLGMIPQMGDDSNSNKATSSSQSGSLTSNFSDASIGVSAANRARSLISLARQLRAEGSTLCADIDRLSGSDYLLRQTLFNAGGSNVHNELLDDLDETLFSALGSGVPSSDPLSCVLANMHQTNGTQSQTGGDLLVKAENDTSTKRNKTKSTLSEECCRLYSQLREAERECYELGRRIDAWCHLNNDSLTETGPKPSFFKTPFTFNPTSCSACSTDITVALLSLMDAAVTANISQLEYTLNKDLIKLLIHEHEGLSSELMSLKRQVLITLASSSEVASKYILQELEKRLFAVEDVTSAEVLGKIVQLEFPLVNKYIDLAVLILQQNIS